MNRYVEKENYIELQIYNNKNNGIVLIDKEDYGKVKEYKWFISYKNGDTGYRKIEAVKGKKKYKIHRIILGLTNPKILVDHINLNTLDNRRSNLRLTNNLDNIRRRTNTIMIAHYGKTLCIGEWCEIYNVSYQKAYNGYRSGKCFDEIFRK